jgi:hypothetical protein
VLEPISRSPVSRVSVSRVPARPAEGQEQWSPKGTQPDSFGVPFARREPRRMAGAGVGRSAPVPPPWHAAAGAPSPCKAPLSRSGAHNAGGPVRRNPPGSGLAGALRCRSSLVWNHHTTLLASCSPSRKASFAATRDREIGSIHWYRTPSLRFSTEVCSTSERRSLASTRIAFISFSSATSGYSEKNRWTSKM